jgi:hypothetical protein
MRIDEMMFDSILFFCRWFGCPDQQFPIALARIKGNDFRL